MSLLKGIIKGAAAIATNNTSAVNQANLNKLVIGIADVAEAERMFGGKARSSVRDRATGLTLMTWHNHSESAKVTFSAELSFDNARVLRQKAAKTRVARP